MNAELTNAEPTIGQMVRAVLTRFRNMSVSEIGLVLGVTNLKPIQSALLGLMSGDRVVVHSSGLLEELRYSLTEHQDDNDVEQRERMVYGRLARLQRTIRRNRKRFDKKRRIRQQARKLFVQTAARGGELQRVWQESSR